LWLALLVGSLFAMIALARAGSTLFWKSGDTPAPGAGAVVPTLRDMLPCIGSLVAVLALTAFAAPAQRYAQEAARDLLDPASLVDQVLRTVPRAGPHQPRPESFR
jgi:multicomponent K+:H+ antiporter subunit D